MGQTRIQAHAQIYHNLIGDSYHNYKTYASEVIQCNVKQSEYCDGKKRARCLRKAGADCHMESLSDVCMRVSKCWRCEISQNSEYMYDPDGVNMAEAQRCSSRGYFYTYTSSPRRPKISASIDVCKGTNINMFKWRSYDRYDRPC